MNTIAIAQRLAASCPEAGNRAAVKDLPDDQFADLMDDPSVVATLTKPLQKCLASRKKREDVAAEKLAQKEIALTGFVDRTIPPTGGIWLHSLAAMAKDVFGKWATKWQVESVARKFDNLTLRRVDYGPPGESALAIFRGKQIPVENHEEIPLL